MHNHDNAFYKWQLAEHDGVGEHGYAKHSPCQHGRLPAGRCVAGVREHNNGFDQLCRDLYGSVNVCRQIAGLIKLTKHVAASDVCQPSTQRKPTKYDRGFCHSFGATVCIISNCQRVTYGAGTPYIRSKNDTVHPQLEPYWPSQPLLPALYQPLLG